MVSYRIMHCSETKGKTRDIDVLSNRTFSDPGNALRAYDGLSLGQEGEKRRYATIFRDGKVIGRNDLQSDAIE